MNYGAAVPTLVCLPICLFIYSRRRSCAPAVLNIGGMAANVVAGGKPVNYEALANVISSLRTSPLFFPTNSLAACHTFN